MQEGNKEKKNNKAINDYLTHLGNVYEQNKIVDPNIPDTFLDTLEQIKTLLNDQVPSPEIVPRDDIFAKEFEQQLLNALQIGVKCAINQVDMKKYYYHFMVILSIIKPLFGVIHEKIEEEEKK